MSHYNNAYFKWQQTAGELAGRINLFLYKKYIQPGDRVIDFGCGGAYLLANLQCAEKLGIEINPEARKQAAANGIKTVDGISQAPDGWADVIISCHALEHTFQPLDEIKSLMPKLRPGGKIIFVVPYERKVRYKANDINQHLYTWSEMNLGNLFTLAGFKVLKVEEIHHRWPPMAHKLMNLVGYKGLNVLSRLYGSVSRKITQVRVVAEKREA
jgi:SAM-dependent methyltransferase